MVSSSEKVENGALEKDRTDVTVAEKLNFLLG